MSALELSGVGVWSSQLRYSEASEAAEAAAELDELGFTALWIPDVGGPVFDAVGRLLAATKRTVIATGILNLWMHSAERRGCIVRCANRQTRGSFSAGNRSQPRAADRRRGSPGDTANRSPPRRRSSISWMPHSGRCRSVGGCSRR